jgi:hypothetical protein
MPTDLYPGVPLCDERQVLHHHPRVVPVRGPVQVRQRLQPQRVTRCETRQVRGLGVIQSFTVWCGAGGLGLTGHDPLALVRREDVLQDKHPRHPLPARIGDHLGWAQ